MEKYLSVTEYAEMTGKDPGNIRRLLIAGRLLGEKVGNQWVIKKGTKYPKDERVNTGKYHNWRKRVKFNSTNGSLSKIIEELAKQLHTIYGNTIKEVILYGSYARGEQTEESDVDIAIIMKKGHTESMHDEMVDLLVEKELEHEKVFSVVMVEYADYLIWKNASPFYKNIDKEGIVIWKAA